MNMAKTIRDIARELWSLLRSRDPREHGGRLFAFAWVGSIGFQFVLLIILLAISGCRAAPDPHEVSSLAARISRLQIDQQAEAARIVEVRRERERVFAAKREAARAAEKESEIPSSEIVERAVEIGRNEERLRAITAVAEAELSGLEKVLAFSDCIEGVIGEGAKPGDVMRHIKKDTVVARGCRDAVAPDVSSL